LADLLRRPLVIGSRGQLGAEMMRVLADCDVVSLDHDEIEIEDHEAVDAALDRLRPSVVINTAAYHNVDACEQNPGRAYSVNTIAVDHLAAASKRRGAVFATMSTDYVFDGKLARPYTEADEPNPINSYGISKFAGELCVQRHGEPYFVFRSSGLYGMQALTQKEKFLERILRQASAGDEIRVVNDVVFAPSYAPDVATTIRSLIERECYGLFHVTNSGHCTWFELASEALRLAGSSAPITPITYRDVNTKTPRPLYSVLGSAALEEVGVKVPDWRDALARYIAAYAPAMARK
jgi:dTDP-4-dehydrorhamnose reductase